MINTINIADERLAEFERVFNLFDANADGSLTRQKSQKPWKCLVRAFPWAIAPTCSIDAIKQEL